MSQRDPVQAGLATQLTIYAFNVQVTEKRVNLVHFVRFETALMSLEKMDYVMPHVRLDITLVRAVYDLNALEHALTASVVDIINAQHELPAWLPWIALHK